jgi:hypothetical protein
VGYKEEKKSSKKVRNFSQVGIGLKLPGAFYHLYYRFIVAMFPTFLCLLWRDVTVSLSIKFIIPEFLLPERLLGLVI